MPEETIAFDPRRHLMKFLRLNTVYPLAADALLNDNVRFPQDPQMFRNSRAALRKISEDRVYRRGPRPQFVEDCAMPSSLI